MAGSFIGAFTSFISRKPWSDLPPGFGYSIQEKISLPFPSFFSLYEGTSRSADKTAVSIFVYDKKAAATDATASVGASDANLEFARNCLKYSKTMLHPAILHTLEAVEVPSGVYVVTERVVPLSCSHILADPVWGVRQVAAALDFINRECKCTHGLVSPYAVFVTMEGDWKLGLFDCVQPLVSSTNSGGFRVIRELHCLAFSKCIPEEYLYNRGDLIVANDQKALAALVCWIYSAIANSETQEVTAITAKSIASPMASPSVIQARRILPLVVDRNSPHLPKGAKQFVRALSRSSQSSDVDIKRLLREESYFTTSTICEVMSFLESISLKGNWEVEEFLAALPEKLHHIPPEIQFLQILPELTRQPTFNSKATHFLPSLLMISDNLSRLIGSGAVSEDVFQRNLTPTLLKLFRMPDRNIRYCLLCNSASLDPHLSSNHVEEIFEALALGLTDAVPLIRESTLKSLLFFFPKLKQSSRERTIRLTTRLLQQDPECSIRTNAMILLAKLATYFPANEVSRTLGNAFIMALRDSFADCRLASLQCISVCVSQDLFSAPEALTRLVPPVAARCIDTDAQVVQAAFTVLQQLVEYAQKHLLFVETSGKDTKHSPKKTMSSTTSEVAAVNKISGWKLSAAPLLKAIEFYATPGVTSAVASTANTTTTTLGGGSGGCQPHPPSTTNGADKTVVNLFPLNGALSAATSRNGARSSIDYPHPAVVQDANVEDVGALGEPKFDRDQFFDSLEEIDQEEFWQEEVATRSTSEKPPICAHKPDTRQLLNQPALLDSKSPMAMNRHASPLMQKLSSIAGPSFKSSGTVAIGSSISSGWPTGASQVNPKIQAASKTPPPTGTQDIAKKLEALDQDFWNSFDIPNND